MTGAENELELRRPFVASKRFGTSTAVMREAPGALAADCAMASTAEHRRMRRNGRPRRPRTRLSTGRAIRKSWTATGASRRIERLDRVKGGLAHEAGGQPVECVPCSPRQVPDLVAQKAQSWKPAPESTEEKRLKFRKTFNERLRERSLSSVKLAARPTRRPIIARSRVAIIPVLIRVACPAACPGFEGRQKITPACMGHRRKRWSCCDSVSRGQSVGGATGCKYRYHLPPSQEPRYGGVAAKMLEDVVRTEKQLDEQIEESRSNSTVRHAMKIEPETSSPWRGEAS